MSDNDKKMPQGNPNQNQNQNQKPGMKPDMDQKKPQSSSDIGKQHGLEKDKQSAPNQVDDDDDKITQRSSRDGNEPLRQK